MKITSKKVLNNWTEFTLTNNNHMSVSFLDYGGIITKIMTPNRHGVVENVVLSYQDYLHYNQNPYYFGAIIGRVAGRIQNASFKLDGNMYNLEPNESPHHLHGGDTGFHRLIWETYPFQNKKHVGVKLTHCSPDGEGGYPGQVNVTVTYVLTNDNKLFIDYEAVTDEKTALSLTNHTYFNLTGQLKDKVHNHIVKMNSDQFLELDKALVPTGNLVDVTKTPFDFRNGRKLLTGFQSTHPQNSAAGHGYDHYFIFHKNEESSIIINEDTSGRVLKIRTNQPGVVMYTGNGLDNQTALQGGLSEKHLGVCFETQGTPASLHDDSTPSITLEPNELYKKWTEFSFSNCE